jgi:hypothetical protein
VTTNEDEHLRRFLRARAREDAAEMRRWWEELVIDFADRIEGMVAATHRGRLDEEEHALAHGLAMTRFARNLAGTFRGVSMGELVNATKVLVRYACIDVQRTSIGGRQRHGAVSLDDGWNQEDPDPAGRSWEAAEALRRHEDDERGREFADFLRWALPRVADTRRQVLEMTIQGMEVPEICAALGIGPANAYARRSRGLKDLAKLKEQYDT